MAGAGDMDDVGAELLERLIEPGQMTDKENIEREIALKRNSTIGIRQLKGRAFIVPP